MYPFGLIVCEMCEYMWYIDVSGLHNTPHQDSSCLLARRRRTRALATLRTRVVVSACSCDHRACLCWVVVVVVALCVCVFVHVCMRVKRGVSAFHHQENIDFPPARQSVIRVYTFSYCSRTYISEWYKICIRIDNSIWIIKKCSFFPTQHTRSPPYVSARSRDNLPTPLHASPSSFGWQGSTLFVPSIIRTPTDWLMLQYSSGLRNVVVMDRWK